MTVKPNKDQVHNDFRGLHIAVVDPLHQKVEAAVFDTFETAEAAEKFIRQPLAYGNIVIAASKHGLCSQKVKDWFTEMGSELIENVGKNEGFAFISAIGSPIVNEKIASGDNDKVNLYQVISTKVLAECHPDMNPFLNPNFGFKSRYIRAVEHSIELLDKAESKLVTKEHR